MFQSFEEYKAEQARLKANPQSSDFELTVKPDYLYKNQTEVLQALAKSHFMGVPAASLTWGIDGNRTKASLTPGIEGEKQTARLLKRIIKKYPSVYAFNSLSWPDSNGDTDHILVYEDLVIIIDSKRWKSKRKYSVTAKGVVKRGTVGFPEGRVKLPYAVHAWRNKLPVKARIQGYICIAQEKVFIVKDGAWYKAPFRLTSLETLEEQIDYAISHHKKNAHFTDDDRIRLLTFFGGLLVEPRDILSNLISSEKYAEYRKNHPLNG